MGQPRSFLARALLGTAPPATAALEGLRVLFNYLVVAGHTHVFASFVLDAPARLSAFDPAAGPLARAVDVAARLGMWASVDVFLFLSGFFFAHSLLRAAPPSPRAAARHVAARWLRLAPLYLLAAAGLRAAGEPQCIALPEALFLHNLFQRWHVATAQVDACIGVGWSLQVDFQMHIALAALAAATPSPRALLPRLLALAAASAAARAVTWARAGRPRRPFPAMIDFIDSEDYRATLEAFAGVPAGAFDLADPALAVRKARLRAYTPWYKATAFRGGAVCVGAATWLVMRDRAPACRAVRARPALSLLVVAAIVAAFYVGMEVFYADAAPPRGFWVYVGFGRLALAFATAVLTILVADVGPGGTGEQEGQSGLVSAVRSVLSSPMLLALGRVSYAVYLLHSLSAAWLWRGWPGLTKETYSMTRVNWTGLTWYLCTVALAVPFCIIEEAGLGIRKRILDAVFEKEKVDVTPAKVSLDKDD